LAVSRLRREPVLVDLDLDPIPFISIVVRPERSALEADPIKHYVRRVPIPVGKLFGIPELPADPLDFAGLAAAIPRGADVTGRMVPVYAHVVPRCESGFHF